MSFWDEMSLQTWILIIEALAILVTASATVKYARLTHSLLKEQKKIIQKPHFQKIVDIVIMALLENIKKQMCSLENRDFGWVSEKHMDLMNIGELTSIFFTYREKLTYYDFKDEFPSINLKIEEYNRKIDELKGKVNDFANGIMSLPNLEREVLERWMEGYTKEEKQKFIIEKDKIIKCILIYIVNNKRELNDRNLYYNFWNKYGNKFLEFQGRKEVKDLKEEIKNKSKELCYLLKDTHYDLINALQKCRKKYNVIPKIEEDIW